MLQLPHVGLEPEAQATEQLERALRHHQVLGDDVDVAERLLQVVDLVDRAAAAGVVEQIDRGRAAMRRVGGGEP